MFETTQAFDGEEGLFLASQNFFDIIILDIMLPSLNGYEVLEQLRKQGINTKPTIDRQQKKRFGIKVMSRLCQYIQMKTQKPDIFCPVSDRATLIGSS